MNVSVHEDIEALGALAPDVSALLAEDPAAGIFHSPAYASTWWSELGGDRLPRLLEMRDGATLRGFAAMSLEADGVLRFLGDQETTDYLGPIARADDRDPVAAALVETIGRIDGWRDAELHGLAADSGWPEALARAAKAAGLEVAERPHDACPRIALAETYDEYLQSLPGKPRHEIRRKARRLEREHGPATVRTSEPSTLDADLDGFYAMHRSSDGPKGKFLHEGMTSFFTRLAHTLADAGWLRLSLLEIGERAAAAIYAFSDGETWSVYNSAYDHEFRSVAPGMVLMAETIRLATEEGCRTFDLLRGTEEYKYRFGAVDMPVIELRLRRAS